MSNNLLPLTMPSSTKTMVGFGDYDMGLLVSHGARSALAMADSARMSAIDAFLSGCRPEPARPQPSAGAAVAGSTGSKPTLVGMPSEPRSMGAPVSAPECLRMARLPTAPQMSAPQAVAHRPASVQPITRHPERKPSERRRSARPATASPLSEAPTSLPLSFPVPVLSGPRSSVASLAVLPYERPIIAAAAVAFVVALGALTMLCLFVT